MRYWVLLLLGGTLIMTAFWPLYLGVAAAHNGLGVTSYGPLLALSAAMFGAGLVCHRHNASHCDNSN
jgi:hypothetical protein